MAPNAANQSTRAECAAYFDITDVVDGNGNVGVSFSESSESTDQGSTWPVSGEAQNHE